MTSSVDVGQSAQGQVEHILAKFPSNTLDSTVVNTNHPQDKPNTPPAYNTLPTKSEGYHIKCTPSSVQFKIHRNLHINLTAKKKHETPASFLSEPSSLLHYLHLSCVRTLIIYDTRLASMIYSPKEIFGQMGCMQLYTWPFLAPYRPASDISVRFEALKTGFMDGLCWWR